MKVFSGKTTWKKLAHLHPRKGAYKTHKFFCCPDAALMQAYKTSLRFTK
jgi:hypothetical protein